MNVTRSLGGRPGFTRIELLVVLAIIGILAALLLPALTKAKARGQRIACYSNLRQIALGATLYKDDFNGGHVEWERWRTARLDQFPDHVVRFPLANPPQ